jgi:ferredoxin
MPLLRVEATPLGPGTTLDAPLGGALLDLCDEARAPVAFSCRSARCGTCRVEVLAGLDALAPPDEEERERLAKLEAPPGVRLACRAVVRPGAGPLTLRWIGPHRAG